ncbi:hypothetical protein SLA2020_111750 [Shorea laevis]
MDAKALAKSKRAHSQHHNKKAHPSQKPKPATEGTSNAANVKKVPNKQVSEKTRQAQRIAKLPSNWDRYEVEFDLGSDDVPYAGATQASDVIVPKSKGADYHQLIADAESQIQSYHYSESVPSLDDVLPGDFNHFVGSMLSVRGESVLSWIGDDNFVVEDRTTATQETSLLSLNLNALAEQLERVDLSQRLFIEADLLPSELPVQGSEELTGNQQSDEMQMISEKKVTTQISKEQGLDDFSEKLEIADQDSDHTSFGSGSKHITRFNGELDLVNQAEDDLASNYLGKADGGREPKSTADDEVVSKKKLLTFEAATAEAELDMLLDSVSETKFLDSPGIKPAITSSTFRKEVTKDMQISRKGPDSSKTSTITASFDDVLDDLLQETSTLVNQTSTSQPRDKKATQRDNLSSSSSSSVPKSKVLDDFDSWLDTI